MQICLELVEKYYIKRQQESTSAVMCRCVRGGGYYWEASNLRRKISIELGWWLKLKRFGLFDPGGYFRSLNQIYKSYPNITECQYFLSFCDD